MSLNNISLIFKDFFQYGGKKSNNLIIIGVVVLVIFILILTGIYYYTKKSPTNSTPPPTVTSTVTPTVKSTVTSTVKSTVTSAVTSTVTPTVTSTVTPTVTSAVIPTVTSAVIPAVTSTVTPAVTSAVIPPPAQKTTHVKFTGKNTFNISQIRIYDKDNNIIEPTKIIAPPTLYGSYPIERLFDGEMVPNNYPYIYHTTQKINNTIDITIPSTVVSKIEIANRRDCCQERIKDFKLILTDNNDTVISTKELSGEMIITVLF